MSVDSMAITPILAGGHRYPLSHWRELSRFLMGDEHDPNDVFCLAEDIWDVRLYAAPHHPANEHKYYFRFGHLRSFLKLYVKWYCYQRILGKGNNL